MRNIKKCFLLATCVFFVAQVLANDSSSTRPGKFRKKSSAAEREASRAEETKKSEEAVNKQNAKDEAFSAITECRVIKASQSAQGLEERVKSYHEHKKAALASYAKITEEEITTEIAGESAEVTKTVAGWFSFCEAMMPKQISQVAAKNKADAEQEKVFTEKQNAMNDRIKKEQEAKFKELVKKSKGDRKRILESKGYLPNWPRSGDLKQAPIWKWEINITHETVRCEQFQFVGDKLKSNSTDIGACP